MKKNYSMQDYVDLLVDDLRDARKQVQPVEGLKAIDPVYRSRSRTMRRTEYLDQYSLGRKEPVSELVKFEKDQFPAPNLLSDEQKICLGEELDKLLRRHRFELLFDKLIPAQVRYAAFRSFLSTSQVAFAVGRNNIYIEGGDPVADANGDPEAIGRSNPDDDYFTELDGDYIEGALNGNGEVVEKDEIGENWVFTSWHPNA